MDRPDVDHTPQAPLPPSWTWETVPLALVLLTAPLCGLGHQTQSPDTTPPAPVEEPMPTDAPDTHLSEGTAPQDPGTRWLDEVRAQRRAWEERRKAKREAFEARRRMADPWGSAQQDAWEDEMERRRSTRRQQMEQQRGLFRGPGPAKPPPPWTDVGEDQPHFPTPGQTPMEPMSQDGLPGIFTEPEGLGIVYPPSTPPRGPYSPPNWDNLWYYRGY